MRCIPEISSAPLNHPILAKIMTMLLVLYVSKDIVNQEFVPMGQIANVLFYFEVLKNLIGRII